MQEINFFNKRVDLTIFNHGTVINKQEVKELERVFKEKFGNIEMTKVKIELFLTASDAFKRLTPIIFGGTTIKAKKSVDDSSSCFAYPSLHRESEPQTVAIMMNRALLALGILAKIEHTPDGIKKLGEMMAGLPQNDEIGPCTPAMIDEIVRLSKKTPPSE